MALNDLAVKAGRAFSDNSPVILTALGVAGTLATAYLTGRAAYRAANVVENEEAMLRVKENNFAPLEWEDVVKKTWKLYMPAAGVAALTCTSIICAHQVGVRRTAALASGITIAQQALTEFRDKVEEKMTAPKFREVQEEIIRDRIAASPPMEANVVVTGRGEVVCQDAYSGRYFKSTVEHVRWAENNVRDLIHSQDYATVSNYYDEVGLEHTAVSDEFGWTVDDGFALRQVAIVCEDKNSPYFNQPVLAFDFTEDPTLQPWKRTGFHG